jgi:hypothetical protein
LLVLEREGGKVSCDVGGGGGGAGRHMGGGLRRGWGCFSGGAC